MVLVQWCKGFVGFLVFMGKICMNVGVITTALSVAKRYAWWERR